MSEFFSRDPDPIDALLRPPSSPDNEALRQSLYTRTQGLLRRRRRLRQFVYAASLLLSFTAGALTTFLILPTRRAIDGDPPAASAAIDQVPARKDDPVLPAGRIESWAEDAEWTAFDSTDHRGELYRQAGDRYMSEQKDLQSALRCYSNSLDNGSEQDLTISPNDNWLLMAIKEARQKEKSYANQGS